ncbi:MAG: hypothetical protein M0Z63_14035 [Actinomycetota bacterium]|jgi:hypothetical protein|nr:hypothetical protein [Actinomycetota bacterium]MDA8281507.1 hypothetical protein [Actinomycetota bacterium]
MGIATGRRTRRWPSAATACTRATGNDPDASAHSQRILDYNEDDVHATHAVRDWLDGPARQLPQLAAWPYKTAERTQDVSTTEAC